MVKKTNLVIAGCTGRMGRMILDILPKSQNFNLVGLLEKSGHPDIGKDYSKVNQGSTFDLDISDNYKETLSRADVLIDFTLPEATLHSLELTKGMDINHVIGTTGFSSAEEEKISMYARSKTIVKAGNVSLGVNLIKKLTEMVASALDEEFDIEILEMHHKEFDEMLDAKRLYCERSISFLDYFFKRLDIYRVCEMPTFIKYYRGVDLEKYKDKIRKITNDFPHLNEKGEVI